MLLSNVVFPLMLVTGKLTTQLKNTNRQSSKVRKLRFSVAISILLLCILIIKKSDLNFPLNLPVIAWSDTRFLILNLQVNNHVTPVVKEFQQLPVQNVHCGAFNPNGQCPTYSADISLAVYVNQTRSGTRTDNTAE